MPWSPWTSSFENFEIIFDDFESRTQILSILCKWLNLIISKIESTLKSLKCYFNKKSLKHLFNGIISKILETDGLRTVVQYDIVGVWYASLDERIYLYASLW